MIYNSCDAEILRELETWYIMDTHIYGSYLLINTMNSIINIFIYIFIFSASAANVILWKREIVSSMIFYVKALQLLGQRMFEICWRPQIIYIREDLVFENILSSRKF